MSVSLSSSFLLSSHIHIFQIQTCNEQNGTFPGTALSNCTSLAPDIEECQSKGKIITLSLGGADSSVGFVNESQAENFADTIWNSFLGGSSDIRPFGSAALDGYASFCWDACGLELMLGAELIWISKAVYRRFIITLSTG